MTNVKHITMHNRKMLLRIAIDSTVYSTNYGVNYVLDMKHKEETFVERKRKRDMQVLQEVQDRLKSSKKWIQEHSYGDGH